MAEKNYTIKLRTKVLKGDTKKQVNDLIKEIEEKSKKISVRIDTEKLKEDIRILKAELANLQEQQKKSNNMKNKNNTKVIEGEITSVEKLSAEYKRLMNQQSSLQKQMSKTTYGGQAYNALNKELGKVLGELSTLGAELDKISNKKVKTDMLQSLAGTFENLQKQAISLGTNLENALKNKDLKGTQLTTLKRLQSDLNKMSENKLNNILKADEPHAEMAKLVKDINNIQNAFNKLNVDSIFTKQVDKAKSKIDSLKNSAEKLKITGYGDTKEIDNLILKLKSLSKIEIKANDASAEASLRELNKQISTATLKYNELKTAMSKKSKRDTLDISIEGAMKKIHQVRDAMISLGNDTKGVDALEKKLNGLKNLNLAEAKQGFNQIQLELKRIAESTPGVEKATDSVRILDSLLKEQAKLSAKGLTLSNAEAIMENKRMIEQTIQEINKLSVEIDKVSKKKIKKFIDEKTISEYDKIQGKINNIATALYQLETTAGKTDGFYKAYADISKTFDRLKSVNLADILNTEDAVKEFQKFRIEVDGLETDLKYLKVDSKFIDDFKKLSNSISDLDKKFNNLKNNSFVNKNDLSDIESRLSRIKGNRDSLNNLNPQSSEFIQKYEEMGKAIERFNSQYERAMLKAKNSRDSFKFTSEIDKATTAFEKLKYTMTGVTDETFNKLKSIDSRFNNWKNLNAEIDKLRNLPYSDSNKVKLDNVRQTINNLNELAKLYNTNSNALKEYNNLITQRNKLEADMVKLPKSSTQYDTLSFKLKEINGEVENLGNKLKLTTHTKMDLSQLSTLSTMLETATNKAEKLKAKYNEIYNTNHQMPNKVGIFGQNNVGLLKDIDNANTKLIEAAITKIRPDGLVEAFAKINETLPIVEQNLKDIDKGFKLKEKVEETRKSLERLISDVGHFQNNSAYTKNSRMFDALKADIDNINKMKIDLDTETAEADLREMQTLLENAKQKFREYKNMSTEAFAKQEIKFNISSALSKIKELEKSIKDVNKGLTLDTIERKFRNLDNTLDTSSQSFKEISAEVKQLTRQLNDLAKSAEKANTRTRTNTSNTTNEVRRTTRNTVTNIRRQITQTTRQANSFSSNLYNSISTYTFGNMIGMQITKGIYAVKETIVQLDSAFRDLQKVAPASFKGTAKELRELKNAAYEAGQEVARSSVDIINSTASALQLGIDNIQDAMQYAKQVNMYANVADIDEATADKYVKSIASAYGGIAESLKPMRSQLKGASDDYNLLTEYMDAANYAGNNFAVTSADIGEALARSASQLKANGNDMGQSIAMIIGANETVQDASKVGNALKSIAVNLNGITYSAKEEELMLNKTAKALRDLAGINVANFQTGRIKTGFEVLDELAKKWETYSEVTRAGIAEALGQKYHANTLMAMIDNWDTVLQYQQEYKDGFTVGSMERENERFINSIEGKSIRLAEQFKGLLTTAFTTDMVKGMIDSLASVLEVLNNFLKGLEEVGGATPLAMAAIKGIYDLLKYKAVPGSELNFLGGLLTTAKKEVRNDTNTIRNTIEETVDNITENAEEAVDGIDDVTEAQNNQTRTTRRSTREWISYSARTALASARSAVLAVGITALNTALTGLVIYGVSQAIKKFYDMAHATEIAREETLKLREETKENISTLRENSTAVKNMAKRYEELSKKTKLSADELNEFNEYKQQLAEKFPELVLGYDELNNPILAVGDNLDGIIEKLDTALNRQLELLKQQTKIAAIQGGEIVSKYRNEESSSMYSVTSFGQNYKTGSDFGLINAKNFIDGINEYNKIRETWEKKIMDINKERAKSFAEYSKIEADQQQSALDELQSNNMYENYRDLTERQKGEVLGLMNVFDWSNELVADNLGKRNYFLRNGFEEVAKYCADNEEAVKEWVKTISLANDAYQRTGDIDGFKEHIEGVTQQLEILTGIPAEEWITGFTQQLQGNIDTVSIDLKKFLESFDSGLEEYLSGDSIARKLEEQFNDLNSFLDEITTGRTTKQSKIDLIWDISQGDSYNKLPPQLRDIIIGTFDGQKKIEDEQEINLLVGLSTYMRSNGALTDGEAMIIQKVLNGEYEENDAEISAGLVLEDGTKIEGEVLKTVNSINAKKENNIEVGLKVSKETKPTIEEIEKELKKFDKINSRGKIKDLFTTEVLNLDQAKFIEELMDKLGTGKKNTISFVLENIDTIKNMTEYKDVVNFLLTHPKIVSEYSINFVKNETYEKGMAEIDSILKGKENKDIRIGIKNAFKIGDLEKLKDLINSLDEEKRIKVATSIADGLKDLKTFDAEILRERLIKTYIDKDDLAKQLQEKEYKITPTVETFNIDPMSIDKISKLDVKIEPKVEPKTDTKDISKTEAEIKPQVKVEDKTKEEVKKDIEDNIKPVIKAEVEVGGLQNYHLDVKNASKGLKKDIEKETTPKIKPKIDTSSVNNFSLSVRKELESIKKTPTISKEVKFNSTNAETVKKDEEEIIDKAKKEIKEVEFNSINAETVKKDEEEIINKAKKESKVVETYTENVRNVIRDLDTIDLKSQDETKTIWVSVKEGVRGAFDWINRLFSGTSKVQGVNTTVRNNIGDFSNISDMPMVNDMQPMASDVSMASAEGGTGEGDVSASAVTPSGYSYKTFGALGGKKTWDTVISLSFTKMIYALKQNIKYFQELENRIARVNNQITLLGNQFEKSVGTERINYLSTQNELYEEQMRLQRKRFDYLQEERSALKKNLKELGFTFNEQGNLTSYEEKLISMQKYYEKLEKSAESAQKAESNYNGKSEKKKKSLNSASESAQKKKDNYQKKLEEAQTLTEAYISLQFTELPQCEQEWQNLKNSIEENNKEIARLELEDKLYEANNAIIELTSNYERLNNQINTLESRASLTGGDNVIDLYKERNNLLIEQLEIIDKNIKQQNRLKEVYKDTLSQRYGFEFTSNGDITNIDEVLNKYQNSTDLEVVKETMEEYLDIQESTLPELESQWYELKTSIDETNAEIERLELESHLYKHKNLIKELENEYQKLNNVIDLNSVKLENLNTNNKIGLYDSQIRAYKTQRAILEREMDAYKKQIEEYRIDLEKYGFDFGKNNDILNLESVLNKYQNTNSLERITELLDEYLDLQTSTLPEVENNWHELGNTIQEVNRQKLEVVKDIEDKITEIYEDEIDKRKEKIEEEKDKLVESLEKQKEAYQKYREEVEYKDEIDEQLKKISKLNSQIAILERDGSLSARAKLESLREELEEENKALEKLRQDELDRKIEELYDKRIESAEKKAETDTKALEEEWDLNKISEYVKKAIDTGYFESIDGEIINLQDKMIEFAETSGEALGIMGDTIKNELVGNLTTAMSILDEYPRIFNDLGLKQFGDIYKEINSNNQNGLYPKIQVDAINISVTGENAKDISKQIAKTIETELGYIANNL